MKIKKHTFEFEVILVRRYRLTTRSYFKSRFLGCNGSIYSTYLGSYGMIEYFRGNQKRSLKDRTKSLYRNYNSKLYAL